MKTFNDLLNESEGVRLTNDYTKYLLEKQYALTKETAKILLEESDDDEGPSGEPFKRVYKGNKIFVHLDVDGKRLIKVVDSKQEASMLAQKYPAMAYSGDGELLRLNERTEEGALDLNQRTQEARVFDPNAPKQRSLAPWAKNIPKAYTDLRKQYEEEVSKNIQLEKEFREKQKLPVDDDAISAISKWKAVYDNPKFADVLDVEEYETHGLKINDPLQIEKVGSIYLPVKSTEGMDEESLKRVKFIAPAHPSYTEKSFGSKSAYEASQAMADTDKLRMAVAAPLVATTALGTLGAAASIPAVATYATPAFKVAEPLIQAALATWYGVGKKQQIEKEIQDTLAGKSATAGAKGAGELAVELPVGTMVAAGAKGPPRSKVAKAIIDPAIAAAETAQFKARYTAPGRAAARVTQHAIETGKAIKEKPKEALAAGLTTLTLMRGPGPEAISGSRPLMPEISAVEGPTISRGAVTQPATALPKLEAPQRFSFQPKAEVPKQVETATSVTQIRPSSSEAISKPTIGAPIQTISPEIPIQKAEQIQQVQQVKQDQQNQQVKQDQRVVQTAQIVNAVQDAVIRQQVNQNLTQTSKILKSSKPGKGAPETGSVKATEGKAGGGMGAPPIGDSDGLGSEGRTPESATTERPEDWNLRLREIYGKLAGTLTK